MVTIKMWGDINLHIKNLYLLFYYFKFFDCPIIFLIHIFKPYTYILINLCIRRCLMENDSNNSSNDEFTKVDFKDGTQNCKNFFSSFFSNPIKTLKNISDSKHNLFFNTAIIMLLVWVLIMFFHALFGNVYSTNGLYIFLSAVRDLTIPIISVGFLALIIYCMAPNKDEKCSLTNTITSSIVCKIPIIFASFISLINLVSDKAYYITNPITYFCIAISIVLTYFAIKFLYKESEDFKSFKRFMIIEGIFYGVYLILSFLGIYMV